MISFNNKSNLLEDSVYHYELQDVAEPKLYRELFSYDEIPKIAFNSRHVPMKMPEEIWMTDTTFRDGQQSTSPFTVKQIVDLFRLMSRLGGEKGLVRQSEFFVYSKKDRDALEACRALGLKFPEITTWIRASRKDFELVKDLEIPETGILVSCSDYHIFKKMNLTRRQAVNMYLDVVKEALDLGIRPRCHFEDITRADFYGFVVPFASMLMDLSKESGIPIKIRMCDTMGFGVTFPGCTLPRSVQGIVYGLYHYAGVPHEMLEWHGHNDFYKVVTNASTAWLYGSSAVNCSLLGIGERTGNCPLEAMAIEYASLRGTTDGMDLSAIAEIGDYFEKEIGYPVPAKTPFVGRAFNTTRAGIHADGMLKDEEIYSIFNTAKILGRPARVIVNNTSGLAGIAFWLNGYFNLPEQLKLEKTDPLIVKMKECVDAQYEEGRSSSFGDDELVGLIGSIDPARLKELFAHSRL